MFDRPFQKTEAGRAEIKARQLPLSRSARNLLLMLDGTRPARSWIEMIKGTSESDLAFLLDQGLIVAVEGAGSPTAAAVQAQPPDVAPAPPPAQEPAALPSTGAMGHDELYEYLTSHARKHLGLIKGYRLVLEVERCTDLVSLQHQAWKLVAAVEESEGEAAAEQLRAEMRL